MRAGSRVQGAVLPTLGGGGGLGELGAGARGRLRVRGGRAGSWAMQAARMPGPWASVEGARGGPNA